MKSYKFAFVDVETTGGSPINDRIIDIGIIQVDNFEVVKEWHTLINPDCSISPFITQITSITDYDVMNAPRFKDVSDTITDLLADRIFVAHNVRFDYSFVRHEFERINQRFVSPHLCTVKLSRILYPELTQHNLDVIIERLQIPITHRHRALPDAQVLYTFIQSTLKDRGMEELESAIKEVCRHPALPEHISSKMIDSLPTTVGVYTFYDSNGYPLYVGKSTNIRSRVMEHFYEELDSDRALEMNRQTAYIDSVVCAGELEALLTESSMVKELRPIYNKKLRKMKELWDAESYINNEGYMCLDIKYVPSVNYADRNSLMAFGRSKNSLYNLVSKYCSQHNLCDRLCGLEQGNSSCFAYHLGRCRGACCLEEHPMDYNHRLEQAFAPNKIQPWPYAQSILWHEFNGDTDLHSYLIIDNWTVLSRFKTFDEIPPTHEIAYTRAPFSLDEYHILLPFITKHAASQVQVL